MMILDVLDVSNMLWPLLLGKSIFCKSIYFLLLFFLFVDCFILTFSTESTWNMWNMVCLAIIIFLQDAKYAVDASDTLLALLTALSFSYEEDIFKFGAYVLVIELQNWFSHLLMAMPDGLGFSHSADWLQNQDDLLLRCL